MKLTTSVVALIAILCVFLAIPVLAKPPTLVVNDSAPLPAGEVQPGTSLSFNLRYSGDPPTSLSLVVITPDGDTVDFPAPPPAGDASEGVDVSWVYKPINSGVYHYHFEAAAGDLGSVRFPADSATDPTFDSVNLAMKWIFFGVGALISMLLLPFIVYTGIRTFHKRGDAAGAAHIGVIVGVLALYGLFVDLFLPIYHLLGAGLGAVALVGALILLFSRK